MNAMILDVALTSLAPRVTVTLGNPRMSGEDIGRALSSLVQGERGLTGNSAIHYEHLQSIAATEWVVNHNLGIRPQITVLSLGGATMWAEVIHASPNQALVYFDEPKAGLAICS